MTLKYVLTCNRCARSVEFFPEAETRGWEALALGWRTEESDDDVADICAECSRSKISDSRERLQSRVEKRASVPVEEVARRYKEGEPLETINRELRTRGIQVSTALLVSLMKERGVERLKPQPKPKPAPKPPRKLKYDPLRSMPPPPEEPPQPAQQRTSPVPIDELGERWVSGESLSVLALSVGLLDIELGPMLQEAGWAKPVLLSSPTARRLRWAEAKRQELRNR